MKFCQLVFFIFLICYLTLQQFEHIGVILSLDSVLGSQHEVLSMRQRSCRSYSNMKAACATANSKITYRFNMFGWEMPKKTYFRAPCCLLSHTDAQPRAWEKVQEWQRVREELLNGAFLWRKFVGCLLIAWWKVNSSAVLADKDRGMACWNHIGKEFSHIKGRTF